ncbi:hypothetical protein D3C81_900530 [compost metagenome]|jgi:hypothetical protein
MERRTIHTLAGFYGNTQEGREKSQKVIDSQFDLIESEAALLDQKQETRDADDALANAMARLK